MKGFAGSAVTWIWRRWQLFLGKIMIFLVIVFMLFYVDGHQFFLSHRLSLAQADGSVTRQFVFLPVQSDITTIISLLASSARLASTLWVVGIDLRCVFLFMERGGVTFEGLKSVIGGSLPGYRQFRQKKNYVIFAMLQVAILTSAFTSSVVSGSVTWGPGSKYLPGQPMFDIRLAGPTDVIFNVLDLRLLESFIGYSTIIYSIFYGTSTSSSMQRLLPDSERSLPKGSRFDEITVPYFAVDTFKWIKHPDSTLSSHQLAAATVVNTTGPRVMSLRKWGLIPENQRPASTFLPMPLIVSESRILVIWTGTQRSSKCELDPTIPSDVQPYMAPFVGVPSCFIFANVTFRAGVARSRRCQLLSNVIRDVGDVKDLQLVGDSMTSEALSLAPYVSTTIVEAGYALPQFPEFPTMQNVSIEILSRSYQVAWNGLTSRYGSSREMSKVSIAVEAPTATVLMWRVGLWGTLHAILVAFGFIFRHIHTSGRHPWIEDPIIAALLVDPTSLINDPSTLAGEDPSYIAAKLKLEERGGKRFIVLERSEVKVAEADLLLENEE